MDNTTRTFYVLSQYTNNHVESVAHWPCDILYEIIIGWKAHGANQSFYLNLLINSQI